MNILYRTNYPVPAESVANVFKRSGIRRPVEELDRIQRMVDNANLTITAWDGDRLIGIGRALTDFSYCCYLSDLAVDKDYQRQGIGQALITQLRDILGGEVTLLLLAVHRQNLCAPKVWKTYICKFEYT